MYVYTQKYNQIYDCGHFTLKHAHPIKHCLEVGNTLQRRKLRDKWNTNLGSSLYDEPISRNLSYHFILPLCGRHTYGNDVHIFTPETLSELDYQYGDTTEAVRDDQFYEQLHQCVWKAWWIREGIRRVVHSSTTL